MPRRPRPFLSSSKRTVFSFARLAVVVLTLTATLGASLPAQMSPVERRDSVKVVRFISVHPNVKLEALDCMCQGKAVISPDWMTASTATSTSYELDYGHGFAAEGWLGQYLVVYPVKKLVAANAPGAPRGLRESHDRNERRLFLLGRRLPPGAVARSRRTPSMNVE